MKDCWQHLFSAASFFFSFGYPRLTRHHLFSFLGKTDWAAPLISCFLFGSCYWLNIQMINHTSPLLHLKIPLPNEQLAAPLLHSLFSFSVPETNQAAPLAASFFGVFGDQPTTQTIVGGTSSMSFLVFCYQPNKQLMSPLLCSFLFFGFWWPQILFWLLWLTKGTFGSTSPPQLIGSQDCLGGTSPPLFWIPVTNCE